MGIHGGELCTASVGCGCLWGGSLLSVHGAGSSIDGESSSMGTGLSSLVNHHVPWMVFGC